jgi:membrane protease YdiL (CAAX protease family)
MLQAVLQFLKNPIYSEDENRDFGYRVQLLFRLLALSLLISIVLGMVIGLLEQLTPLDLGDHAMDLFLDNYSPWIVFLVAVFLAPFLEELLFRGPMVFFKKSRYFGVFFYAITLVFGFYHITNFELNTQVVLASPILVLPQLCVGVFLGFIRVRLGLLWAMALHALYNLILLGPVLLLRYLNFPLA